MVSIAYCRTPSTRVLTCNEVQTKKEMREFMIIQIARPFTRESLLGRKMVIRKNSRKHLKQITLQMPLGVCLFFCYELKLLIISDTVL